MACVLKGTHYSHGRHVTQMTVVELRKAMMYWWLTELFYILTTSVMRLSIAFFLRRIMVSKIRELVSFISANESLDIWSVDGSRGKSLEGSSDYFWSI